MLTNKIFNASALEEVDLSNSRQTPARLLAYGSNIVGIWQQGCRQLPATTQNDILKVNNTGF